MPHSKQAVDPEIIIDQGVSQALDGDALIAVAGGVMVEWHQADLGLSTELVDPTRLDEHSRFDKVSHELLRKF